MEFAENASHKEVLGLLSLPTARKSDNSGWLYPEVKSIVKVDFGNVYQLTFRRGASLGVRAEVEDLLRGSPWVVQIAHDVSVEKYLEGR